MMERNSEFDSQSSMPSYSKDSTPSYRKEMELLSCKFQHLALSSVENQASANVSTDIDDNCSGTDEVFKNSSSSPVIMRRSSLWKLFDPLQSVVKTQQIKDERPKSFPTASVKEINGAVKDWNVNSYSEHLNENASNILSGDTLISFESPKKLAKPLVPKHLFPESNEPFKKYTEDEFHHILETQKHRLFEEFSKKLTDYEMLFAKKDEKLERKLSKIEEASELIQARNFDALEVIENKLKTINSLAAKLKDFALEKEKLETDIKTSKEDLNNVETAFSDFHKHYEQCKIMVKTCEENKQRLIKNSETMQVSLDKQSNMNDMLESRTAEVLDKARAEVQSAKKSFETQVTKLEAQLKKAEMKICSLEIDLKQAKFENDKLGNIYEDLVSKIT